MKRVAEVMIGEDGCLRPDVGKGCFVCFEQIWATDWESDLCPWCEVAVTDAEFQRAADITGFDLRRYTHTLRYVLPTETRRQL